jgi:hypothetical protein
MEQIVIQVGDKEKIKMLTALNFVHLVHTTPQNVEPTALFSMAGLWEGREVTLTSIRQKAWRNIMRSL